MKASAILLEGRITSPLENHKFLDSLKTDCSLISNFRHVLNVICFLLGNSPASKFYMLTFRNTLSVQYS
jgi:hypothetical protein